MSEDLRAQIFVNAEKVLISTLPNALELNIRRRKSSLIKVVSDVHTEHTFTEDVFCL